jgi:hypothetical protein
MKFGAGAVKELGRHLKCCRISGLVGEAADVRRLEHRSGDDGRSVLLSVNSTPFGPLPLGGTSMVANPMMISGAR